MGGYTSYIAALVALSISWATTLHADCFAPRTPQQYWHANLGGEWDFIADDVTPLNGDDWSELHYGIGYVDKQHFTLAAAHRLLGRGDDLDHLLGLDASLRLIDTLWLRLAPSTGINTDFAHHLRQDIELIYYYRNWSIGGGYWYIHHQNTDVHAPTLFIEWQSGAWSLHGRGLYLYDTLEASWFPAISMRAAYQSCSRWLAPFVGIVHGERIFGILTLQQSLDQEGLILYAGNRFAINDRINWSVYGSYAQETSVFDYIGVGSELQFTF